MSISQVLLILWRRGWITLLTFLSALLVALAVLELVPGRYDAVATASIDPGGIDPIARMMQGGSDSTIGLVQGNLLQLVTSKRIASDVVKRLNLTANPQIQAQYRKSEFFGRENIDDWYASTIAGGVVPSFTFGTNVLSIKYKSSDPSQAALLANAYLAATIDETIAMRADLAEQVARWFAPQLDDLRKQVEEARAKAQAYQKEANLPGTTAGGGDPATSHLITVTQNLSSAKANLTYLQSRLAGSPEDLANDPSDPDLQELNNLKAKVSELETSVAATKSSLGLHNPRVASIQSMIDSIRKQIPEVTDKALEKVRAHLKQRIEQTRQVITSLEAELEVAQKTAIAAQAQRDRLNQLQHDVDFRLAQLNSQERMAEQARLQSKLTLVDITVLDKAVPPIGPAFPKPLQVMLVAIGAGLALGLILALLAEMTDRRVRFPDDLVFVTSAPMLGIIHAARARGKDMRALPSPRIANR